MNSARVGRSAVYTQAAAIAAYTVAWLPMWIQPIFLTELLSLPTATKTFAGIVLSGEVAALSVSSAVCARYISGISYRTLLIAALGLIALGDLLGLATHNLTALLLTRLICGLGEGTALMVSYTALSNSADPDRAYANIALWSTPIASVAVYFAPAIGHLFGGAQTFPTLLVFLAVMLPGLLLMPGSLHYTSAERSTTHAFTGHGRQILLVWIATFLFVLVNAATWPFYFVLGLRTGLTSEQVNNAIVLSIIASILGSLLTSILGSRFGRRVPFAIGLTLVSCAVALMAYGTTPAAYLIGINLNMLASYFVLPYFAGFAASQDPSGRGVALVGIAGPIAFSLGAGAGGFLWDYGGRVAITGMAISASLTSFLILSVAEDKTSRSATVSSPATSGPG